MSIRHDRSSSPSVGGSAGTTDSPRQGRPGAHAAPVRLQKSLKPHWVVAIALGSAVGWGAFVLPVDWMDTAGPLGALMGLAIGAL